jgi:hypothetical protein
MSRALTRVRGGDSMREIRVLITHLTSERFTGGSGPNVKKIFHDEKSKKASAPGF